MSQDGISGSDSEFVGENQDSTIKEGCEKGAATPGSSKLNTEQLSSPPISNPEGSSELLLANFGNSGNPAEAASSTVGEPASASLDASGDNSVNRILVLRIRESPQPSPGSPHPAAADEQPEVEPASPVTENPDSDSQDMDDEHDGDRRLRRKGLPHKLINLPDAVKNTLPLPVELLQAISEEMDAGTSTKSPEFGINLVRKIQEGDEWHLSEPEASADFSGPANEGCDDDNTDIEDDPNNDDDNNDGDNNDGDNNDADNYDGDNYDGDNYDYDNNDEDNHNDDDDGGGSQICTIIPSRIINGEASGTVIVVNGTSFTVNNDLSMWPVSSKKGKKSGKASKGSKSKKSSKSKNVGSNTEPKPSVSGASEVELVPKLSDLNLSFNFNGNPAATGGSPLNLSVRPAPGRVRARGVGRGIREEASDQPLDFSMSRNETGETREPGRGRAKVTRQSRRSLLREERSSTESAEDQRTGEDMDLSEDSSVSSQERLQRKRSLSLMDTVEEDPETD